MPAHCRLHASRTAGSRMRTAGDHMPAALRPRTTPRRSPARGARRGHAGLQGLYSSTAKRGQVTTTYYFQNNTLYDSATKRELLKGESAFWHAHERTVSVVLPVVGRVGPRLVCAAAVPRMSVPASQAVWTPRLVCAAAVPRA